MAGYILLYFYTIYENLIISDVGLIDEIFEYYYYDSSYADFKTLIAIGIK